MIEVRNRRRICLTRTWSQHNFATKEVSANQVGKLQDSQKRDRDILRSLFCE